MSGRLKPGVRSYKNIDNAGNELIVLTVDHIVEWQGEPAMQITIIDLSSQIETQRQLKASEERYRELIDGSIQGIVVHRDLTPLFCNRAYARCMALRMSKHDRTWIHFTFDCVAISPASRRGECCTY